MKRHVIITSCNERYGNFLICHWYPSLIKHVDTKNIDVIVLDYGLNEKQCDVLKRTSVIVKKQTPSTQVVNKRFIDAIPILEKSTYEQVLMIDCGDIIFQDDISFLFEKDKHTFRAVPLDLEVLFHEIFIPGNFRRDEGKKIYNAIKNKPVINAGFILAPREKFIHLCKQMDALLINQNHYGPDQVIVNYILHTEGVKLLPNIYNFMINNVKDSFTIQNGIFYTSDHTIIPVVHNAGHNGFLRPIFNFGYGEKYNKVNYPMYLFKRWYYANLKYLKKIAARLLLQS